MWDKVCLNRPSLQTELKSLTLVQHEAVRATKLFKSPTSAIVKEIGNLLWGVKGVIFSRPLMWTNKMGY